MAEKSSKRLGDTHNFGRYVHFVGKNYVFKPRPLLWEWILLSEKSPFRQAFEDVLSSSPILMKNFLPDLEFGTANLQVAGLQQLATKAMRPLAKVSHEDQLLLCLAGGQLLALMSWLGIKDLHYTNLALGRCGSEIKFGPIDIEMIFSKIDLPQDTLLIPSRLKYDLLFCGLHRIRSFLGKSIQGEFVLASLFGYVEQLRLIRIHQEQLLKALQRTRNMNQVPIRYLIRHTRTYYQFLKGDNPKIDRPVLKGEAVQLERGDIPYFFRTLAEPDRFFYYSNSSLTKKSEVSRQEILQIQDKICPLQSVRKGWSDSRFRFFLNEGTMLFFTSLHKPSKTGVFDFMGSEMKITKNSVCLNFLNGPLIHSGHSWEKFSGRIPFHDLLGKQNRAVVITK